MSPPLDLRGAPAAVTGAASGIGRALCRELLREGCRVLALDIDARGLQSLAEEAGLLGFEIETLAADVGDGESFIRKLNEHYPGSEAPRVFINNAGIARLGSFSRLGLESFEAVRRVNLDGLVAGTHWALTRMEAAGGGTIVNMASTAGHVPAAFLVSYAAAKFAVVGFTRSLQAELSMAGSAVRLCLVSPGFVDTPIMSQPGASLPRLLRWMVADASSTARAVVRALKEGRAEVYPDLGGRLIAGLYRLAPRATVTLSRILVADSPAELLGRSPIRK